MEYIKLSEICVGEECVLKRIDINTSIKRRIQDLGFIKESNIKCVLKGPLNDPTAYRVKGSIIALRKEICDNIIVERV